MEEVTIKLPLKVIRELLSYVPEKELENLRKKKRKIKSVPMSHLRKLIDMVSIGGDALKDTEEVWEE